MFSGAPTDAHKAAMRQYMLHFLRMGCRSAMLQKLHHGSTDTPPQGILQTRKQNSLRNVLAGNAIAWDLNFSRGMSQRNAAAASL